jgi:D-glycero-D-manno-heptose 1,7-bisphosphate phosphatase
MNASKIIFIDRDGVINVDLGGYVTRPEDFRFETGAGEALKKFSLKGYRIIVISNQAGVGDGVFTEEQLEAVQQSMEASLRKENVVIERAYYCLHGKQAGCLCRKPKTGLFEQAAEDFYFNPAETFFIGDKAGDIEAGKSFGLQTVLVRTGYGRDDEKKLTGSRRPDFVTDSLRTAADLECFQ